jgi:hypothetical protein
VSGPRGGDAIRAQALRCRCAIRRQHDNLHSQQGHSEMPPWLSTSLLTDRVDNLPLPASLTVSGLRRKTASLHIFESVQEFSMETSTWSTINGLINKLAHSCGG